MQSSSLMERYVRAMIDAALRSGFDAESIGRAMVSPAPIPNKLSLLPVQQAALDAFVDGLGDIADAEPLPDLDKNFRVSPEIFARYQQKFKWLLQDDFYRLTPGRCKVGTFLVMAELVLSADTLEQTLRKGFRFYSAVTDDVRFSLNRSDPFAEIRVELTHPALDPHYFLIEWLMFLWHRMASWLIGEKIPIIHAEFPHPPASPLSEYQGAFGQQCTFEKTAGVVRFYSLFLDRHIVRRKHDLEQLVMQNSFDLISIPGLEDPLAPRVAAQLEHHFDDALEFISMEDIAAHYRISSQTLRRRLEGEGSSYRSLKDQVRRNAAMRWLADASLPLAEVARLSGFADANGLSRAFKSWTGQSPSAYRAKMRRTVRGS